MQGEIYELEAGGGVIALCPMSADMVAWRPDLVVSMTQDHEFRAGLLDELAAVGMAWRQVPVADYGIPADPHIWPQVEAEMLAFLAQGGRVLVHCMGGCGRSGMALLRCMIALGEDPEAALKRLRTIRPCAVETPEQLHWAQTP